LEDRWVNSPIGNSTGASERSEQKNEVEQDIAHFQGARGRKRNHWFQGPLGASKEKTITGINTPAPAKDFH